MGSSLRFFEVSCRSFEGLKGVSLGRVVLCTIFMRCPSPRPWCSGISLEISFGEVIEHCPKNMFFIFRIVKCVEQVKVSYFFWMFYIFFLVHFLL